MPGCLPSHQVDSGCTASARAFALPLHCPCTAWFLAVLTEPLLTTLRYISSTTVHSSSSLAYNLNSQPSPFVEQTLGDEPLQFHLVPSGAIWFHLPWPFNSAHLEIAWPGIGLTCQSDTPPQLGRRCKLEVTIYTISRPR